MIPRSYYQRHILRHHSEYINNLYRTKQYWPLYVLGADLLGTLGSYISMYAAAGLAGVEVGPPFDLTKSTHYEGLLAKTAPVAYPKPPDVAQPWGCPICGEARSDQVQPFTLHRVSLTLTHQVCEACAEELVNHAAKEAAHPGQVGVACPLCRAELDVEAIHTGLVRLKVTRVRAMEELSTEDFEAIPDFNPGSPCV